MKIFPLSEGVFTIGHDKIMVPFDLANDQLNERPIGSLLVEIQPFLIQTARHLILLDSGLGFRGKSGEWQIFENIHEAGFRPEQVTHVIQSHLHKDHSGGLCFENELGIKSLAFPNARYFISALEFDEGLRKGIPSYHPEDFAIWIHEENETVFFGGDNAPQLKQLKTKYVAKYDYDGQRAMELRQQFAQQGREENWTFLFYHDNKTPYSKLV
jgi:glyoxylase-like metal-dependent hydrolase (beta-lactamase superfamily II)